MPTTNLYFNNFEMTGEQRLVDDLITESIKIHGMETLYMPRTLINDDKLFNEDVMSEFKNAYALEMYILSADGFEGQGDFLSKFGVQIRDEIKFTVSRRRFSEEIPDDCTTEALGRPVEGDLVYFPLTKKIYEVKFVEHEAIFYQMGSLQTYDLSCELFEYSHQEIDTGIAAIDKFETQLSGDMRLDAIKLEDSTVLLQENGFAVINEDYAIQGNDAQANNDYFDTASDDVITPEDNPFSLGSDF